MRFPFLVFLASFVALWISVQVGIFFRTRRPLKDDEREDFKLVQGATLTLLGLIIGFSFSMATSRYDLRKKCEAEEANAIGTALHRSNLLPVADDRDERSLLRKYLAERILFYAARDEGQLQRVQRDTDDLETKLWSSVTAVAEKQPTFMTALVVSGINDVLNSQGYTQAAWLNRIPVAAWGLMGMISIFGGWSIAYGARSTGLSLLLVFPLLVSISFYLIADLDSPRGGLIRVLPQNLVSLSQGLDQP